MDETCCEGQECNCSGLTRLIIQLTKKTTLANATAAIVTVAGLYVTYKTGNKEVFGVIVGAALTWLYKMKNSS